MMIKVTPPEGHCLSLQTVIKCTPLCVLQRISSQQSACTVFEIRGEVTREAFDVLHFRLVQRGATLEVIPENNDLDDYSFV